MKRINVENKVEVLLLGSYIFTFILSVKDISENNLYNLSASGQNISGNY